jgi:hypothetical protein
VNVGFYQVTLSLLDPVHSSWSDDTKEDIVITFEITPMVILLPAVSVTSFAFDGTIQTPLVTPGAGSFVTGASVSVAGIHTLEVRLFDKDNLIFENGSNADIIIEYEIAKKEIALPVAVLTQVAFTGFLNYPGVNISDGAILVGDYVSQAGLYSFYVELIDPLNTAFENTSITRVAIPFEIKPRVVTVPAVGITSFAFTNFYDGPDILAYEGSIISGTRVALNVGVYQVSVVLEDPLNSVFSNGTNAAFIIDFKITPKVITTPAVLITQFAWSGNIESPMIDHGDYTYTSFSAIADAGIYQAFIVLNDEDNMIFDNGTNVAIQITYQINPMIVSLPAVLVTSYGFTSFDTFVDFTKGIGSNVTGTLMATSVGIYSLTFSLDNPTNQRFEDGTIEPITLDWEITTMVISNPAIVRDKAGWTGSDDYPGVILAPGSKLEGDLVSNVGIYTFYVSLEDPLNTVFENGSSEDIPVVFEIEPMIIDDPTVVKDTFTWEIDLSHVLGITASLGSSVTGTTLASEAGTYTAKVEVDHPGNQTFEDGATEKTITWTIEKKEIDVPSSSATPFSYHPDGSGPINDNPYLVGSNLTQSGLGTFNAVFTLKYPDNTLFKNGETLVMVPYTITKAVIDLSLLSWDYEYAFNADGTIKTVTLEEIPLGLTVTYSNHTGSATGTYTATAIGSADPDFYILEGTMAPLSWAIVSKENLSLPGITDESLIYTGNLQIPEYLISQGVLVTTETSIDAGTYTITFSLIDPNMTQWEDGTLSDIVETYTIEKASLDLNQVTLTEAYFLEGAVDIRLENVPEGVTLDFDVNQNTGHHLLILSVTYNAMNYQLVPRNTVLSYTVYPSTINLPNQDIYVFDETLRFEREILATYEDEIEAIDLEINQTLEDSIVYTWRSRTSLMIEDVLNDITFRINNPSKTLYLFNSATERFERFNGGEIHLGDIILETTLVELPQETPESNIVILVIAVSGGVIITGGFIAFKFIKNKRPI